MGLHIRRRLMLFVPTLFLASVAIFILMRILPGDVAAVIAGGEASDATSIQQLENIREQLGLKDPLIVQYGRWGWSMVAGELGGRSLVEREPISQIIARRLPITLLLAVYAITIAVIVSIPLGILAAVRQDTFVDYFVRIMTISGHALPNFFVALLVILMLLVWFAWTPPIEYKSLMDDPWAHIQKVMWPALILAWGLSANVTRVTRSGMLEVLRQDYVRTARSKGLKEGTILWRHALLNALIPVITLSGVQLATLLSGAVILESIFGLPGLGQGIVLAAGSRDYPVIQSVTMLLVAMTLTLNLLLDILCGVIDPRISYH